MERVKVKLIAAHTNINGRNPENELELRPFKPLFEEDKRVIMTCTSYEGRTMEWGHMTKDQVQALRDACDEVLKVL